MKRLSSEEAGARILSSIQSVGIDMDNGKMKQGENVASFYRLHDDHDGEEGLSDENMVDLIMSRLEMMGIVMYFDSDAAREALDKGLRRLEGLL